MGCACSSSAEPRNAAHGTTEAIHGNGQHVQLRENDDAEVEFAPVALGGPVAGGEPHDNVLLAPIDFEPDVVPRTRSVTIQAGSTHVTQFDPQSPVAQIGRPGTAESAPERRRHPLAGSSRRPSSTRRGSSRCTSDVSSPVSSRRLTEHDWAVMNTALDAMMQDLVNSSSTVTSSPADASARGGTAAATSSTPPSQHAEAP